MRLIPTQPESDKDDDSVWPWMIILWQMSTTDAEEEEQVTSFFLQNL